MKIKIVLADDHPLICQGVKSILQVEEDMHIVKEVTSCQQLIKVIKEIKPEIILLNLSILTTTDREIVRCLCKEYSHICKILVLTDTADNEDLDVLLNLGISGYLLKCDSAILLQEAIRKVMDGGQYLPEKAKGSKGKKTKEEKSLLTVRELEIIQLIGKGMKNVEIAEELFLSEKTVKNHLTNIFKKLKLNDRTQVLIYAIKNKLVFLS